MFRTTSFRFAGLVLAAAAALPSAASADGFRVPTPVPVPVPSPLPQPDRSVLLRVPDLVGTTSWAFRPVGGTSTTARMIVRNDGLGAAGAFDVQVTVSVAVPGADIPSRIFHTRTMRVAGLASGASRELLLDTFPVSTGQNVIIEGRVDSRGEVGEINERNNRFSFWTRVR